MSGRLVSQSVVGGNKSVFAILLQSFITGGAVLTAVDHAAHAHGVTYLEACNRLANRGDVANDLMARYARVKGAFPLAAHLVKIGMANSAIRNIDLHIMWPGWAPPDGQGLQRPQRNP